MKRKKLVKNRLKKGCLLCICATVLCTGCKTQEETKATSKPAKSDALVPRWMDDNHVEQNPYLSDSEAAVHNDIYNSDVTGKAMPMGIYSEIIESAAQDSPNSPPAFFYDNRGNAIVPYTKIMEDGSTLSGGIAIRDVDSPNLDVVGSFQPMLDDKGAQYGIQITYSFVDKNNYLIGPTTNGHVVMIRTCDENGKVLSTFEKMLDVDIVSNAVKALGDGIDKNLLSLVYDYEGNIWFVTGGFHKNPAYSSPGFCGYLEREYIDRLLAGETDLDPQEYLHYMKLGEGENAENGIAAHPEGCVILTNTACHLLEAGDDLVETRWSVPYESAGGKASVPGAKITGAGLAWGGGSSPTLTDDMVLFTDNQDVVNLIAVDIKNGKKIVETPVLDMGKDVIVSVENSISVYSSCEDRVSALICNWYGAGNTGLFEANADSSVQSYNNLYDDNWREKGSAYLMPGVERVDIVKKKDGSYQAKEVWRRDDLKDTSMIKLSTGAGYYYGYTQDEETSQWGFIVLDYNTGDTVMWKPVSDEPQYNNIAVGIMQGDNGNSIYCPTNSQVLVRLQDRFVYLPEEPEKKLDITKMERRLLTEKEFQKISERELAPATYLMSGTVTEARPEETIAFRVNGLDKTMGEYAAFYEDQEGMLKELENIKITDESGREIPQKEKLEPETIYEIRVSLKDGGKMDLDQKAEVMKISIIIGEK